MKKLYVFALLSTILMMMLLVPLSDPARADTQTGTIYGYTYQYIGWDIYPVAYVVVTAGTQQDISDLNGYYELTNLPLNQVLEVRASKPGYSNITFNVVLTPEQPSAEVDFILAFHFVSAQLAQQYQQYQSMLKMKTGLGIKVATTYK